HRSRGRGRRLRPPQVPRGTGRHPLGHPRAGHLHRARQRGAARHAPDRRDAGAEAVKTPEKNSKPYPKKQKKQTDALGALSALFVALMIVQFGGSKQQSYEVAALAVAPDAEAPAADAATPPAPEAKDNAVLSAPSSTADLKRSPFANFWNAPSANPAAVPDVAAPNVIVNATMPSETRPMAIIDGELHFVGDTV